jgi:hypothetical protein
LPPGDRLQAKSISEPCSTDLKVRIDLRGCEVGRCVSRLAASGLQLRVQNFEGLRNDDLTFARRSTLSGGQCFTAGRYAHLGLSKVYIHMHTAARCNEGDDVHLPWQQSLRSCKVTVPTHTTPDLTTPEPSPRFTLSVDVLRQLQHSSRADALARSPNNL